MGTSTLQPKGRARKRCRTSAAQLDALDARYEFHHALADLEGASAHLERALRSIDAGLMPPVAILLADTKTVMDRLGWVIKAAA